MSSGKHWATITEAGTLLGMRILIFAYRIGGNCLLKIFLAPVIGFYFIFHPAARKASQEFLVRARQQGADIPVPRWWHSLAHLWQFGIAIVDKFAVWMERITLQDLTISGSEIIEDLLENKQGAVILISHLGNFEICQCFSKRHEAIRISAFHHTKNSEKFHAFLKQFNQKNQVEILQVTEIDTETAIRLSEKVSHGEFIVIAGDRIPVANKNGTFPIEFMGAPAPFPKGPFALATALKAPVLFLTCIKKGSGFHVTFEQLSIPQSTGRKSHRQKIERLAASYASRLQYHCLQ